jgi:hypothetical protein
MFTGLHMSKPISIRASEFTINQINLLVRFTGMSKTGILALAINNLFVNTVLVGDVFDSIRLELIKRHYKDLGLKKEVVENMLKAYTQSGGVLDFEDVESFDSNFRFLMMFRNKKEILRLLGYQNE